MTTLISLSKKDYNVDEILERLMTVILNEDYSEDYLLLIFELTSEDLTLFTPLVVGLGRFIQDVQGHDGLRTMIHVLIHKFTEQLKEKRKKPVVQPSTCSIL